MQLTIHHRNRQQLMNDVVFINHTHSGLQVTGGQLRRFQACMACKKRRTKVCTVLGLLVSVCNMTADIDFRQCHREDNEPCASCQSEGKACIVPAVSCNGRLHPRNRLMLTPRSLANETRGSKMTQGRKPGTPSVSGFDRRRN